MYRAFDRKTSGSGEFIMEQFSELLAVNRRVVVSRLSHVPLCIQKWGVVKQNVTAAIFNAYAEDDILTYANAIRALCGLGVGNRVKQAEAVFSICDEDGGGLVSRSEFLKFIAGSLPEDTSQHKSETFSKASTINCKC